jgi:FdhD protein
MALPIDPLKIFRYSHGKLKSADDLVVVEEPMEIRLGYGSMDNRKEESIAITMRTPGDDFELAVGFLFSEGVIQHKKDILSVKYCFTGTQNQEDKNIVRVELIPDMEIDLSKQKRNFFAHSGCGICGKASIDAVYNTINHEAIKTDIELTIKTLLQIPVKTLKHQVNFNNTGGIHSASIFDSNNKMLAIKEDVGRHNAVDKILGHFLLSDDPDLSDKILFLSGRMGFELVQKASMAHLPIVVSVGAPTSLSVKLGKELGMTLVGFTRENKFNIYCGEERIV